MSYAIAVTLQNITLGDCLRTEVSSVIDNSAGVLPLQASLHSQLVEVARPFLLCPGTEARVQA